MTKKLEAIFENGVLRPIEPLVLKEHQRVLLTLSGLEENPPLCEDWRAGDYEPGPGPGTLPSLEEVRKALASIPGSMSADFTAERGDH
jgi:hypothetical protein